MEENFRNEEGDKLLLEFNIEKKVIGRVIYNKNKEMVRYEGNVEEGSKLFFDYLIRYLKLIEIKPIGDIENGS